MQVIDSLIVELALDPTKFTEGQRKAVDDARKAYEEVQIGATRLEDTGKRMGMTLSDIKRVAVGGLAAFGIGLGVAEIVKFTANLVNADAATSRIARTMDISTKTLATWQGAARAVGGSAEGMTGTLQRLSTEINTFALTGQSNILGVLTQLGVSLNDSHGGMIASTELMLRLADAVRGMDPAKARALLSLVGADQDAINLMMLGRAEMERLLAAQGKFIHDIDASAAAGKKYQETLSEIGTALGDLDRTFITTFGGSIARLLEAMRNLVDPTIWKHDIEESRQMWGGWLGWLGDKLSFGKEDRQRWQNWEDTVRGGAPSGGAGSIPVKPGAGTASPFVSGVLGALSGVSGIKEVTSMNDAFHQMLGGAHARGMAVDVTLTDPSQSGAMATKIKAILASQGISANVIDEYKSPSAHATGGHLHIGIGGGIGGVVGAPAAAAHHSMLQGGSTSTRSMTIEIGEVHVNAPAAKDADGIAGEISSALKRQVAIASWNSGLA